MLDGDDLRRKPLNERKAILRKVLRPTKDSIQYVGTMQPSLGGTYSYGTGSNPSSHYGSPNTRHDGTYVPT
jgi:hypothetical protein